MPKTISSFFLKVAHIRFVFILALIIRYFLSPQCHVDEQRYLLLSDQIVAGNFDMDAGSFLCAPFTPYFVAGLKYISLNYWYALLFVSQVIISSLCVFSLYQIALRLFGNKNVALLAALIYAVYPDTFMYVRLVGQEVFFQSFLIFSIHYLLQFVQTKQIRAIFLSAVFFSFCFLTKSFILLWSPFIVLYLYLNKTISSKTKATASILYASVCLVFTMPIGFYNLLKHNEYTLSSNGGSFLFWNGNSEFAYIAAIEKKNYVQVYPEAAARDNAYQIHFLVPPTPVLSNYLATRKSWGSVQNIQKTFGQAAVEWVKANPKKFWQLRAYNFFRFILPGAKPPDVSIFSLFFIFLSAGLLYFSAFMGLKKGLTDNFRQHNWLLTLWLTMLVFSVVFGTYIRFRTITIDSFLCLYAAFYLNQLFEKYKIQLSLLTKLNP